jgi:hypothetical protein
MSSAAWIGVCVFVFMVGTTFGVLLGGLCRAAARSNYLDEE